MRMKTLFLFFLILVACSDEESLKNNPLDAIEISSSSEEGISSSSSKEKTSISPDDSTPNLTASSNKEENVSSSSEEKSSSSQEDSSSSRKKIESSSSKEDSSNSQWNSSSSVKSSSSEKNESLSSNEHTSVGQEDSSSSSPKVESSSSKEDSSNSQENSSSSANSSSSSATIPSKLYDCEEYKCVTTKYLNPDIEYGEYLDVRDSQVYRTVQIGEQVWMAQNLNYKSDMQSFCFDNDDNNCAKWGRLYTWAQAVKACPEGWKLPDSSEYGSLAIFLKDSTGNKNVGKYLKTGKNNLFGFSVLLGSGYFVGGPDYFNEGGETYGRAYFWTASETDEQNTLEPPDKYAIIRSLKYSNDIFGILPWEKVDALSVRCLKNI